MIRRALVVTILASLLAACGGGAAGTSPGSVTPMQHTSAQSDATAVPAGATAEPTTGPLTDQSFAIQMAQSGLAEVQMAQLALTKSRKENVIAFARKMIEDHTKNNQELQSIMSANGISVPSSLGEADARTLQQLQSLNESSFDAVYVPYQVIAHQKVQALLQTELSVGKNEQLKAYAQATLPVITMHLEMAQQLAASFSPPPSAQPK